jgi:hypothetical protein
MRLKPGMILKGLRGMTGYLYDPRTRFPMGLNDFHNHGKPIEMHYAMYLKHWKNVEIATSFAADVYLLLVGDKLIWQVYHLNNKYKERIGTFETNWQVVIS